MITTSLLTVADVQEMFAAVLQYNRRGDIVGLRFCDEAGAPLPVVRVEVWCEEKGLAVRAAPEPSTDELGRMLNPPVADPRKVPGAASVGELSALARS